MSETDMELIRQLLRSLPQYGIKIVDFARELGVHPTTIYNYIRGYCIPRERASQILTALRDNHSKQVGELLVNKGFLELLEDIDSLAYFGVSLDYVEEMENAKTEQ